MLPDKAASLPLADFVRLLRRYLGFRWLYLSLIVVVGIATEVATRNPGANAATDLITALVGAAGNAFGQLLAAPQHRSHDYYRLVAWYLIASDVILSAFLVFNRGGVESRSIILFAIPIIITAGLFGRAAATYFTAALCALSYDLIILFDWSGWLPTKNVLYPQLHHDSGYVLTSLIFYSLVVLLIAAVADFVGHILVRDQLNLRRNQEYLELQRMVAASANEASSAEEALKIVTDLFCIYTRSPLGHAFLVSPSGTVSSLPIWYIGEPGDYTELQAASQKPDLSDQQTLPGRVMKQRGPVWMKDLSTTRLKRQRHFSRLNLVGGLAFPITIDGRIVAILEFFSPRVIERSDDIEALIKYINTQMSQVFLRHRNEEDLRLRTQELETFNQIMVGREVRMAELKRQLKSQASTDE